MQEAQLDPSVWNYEAFTVSTAVFFRRKPQVVLGFFEAMRRQNSTAFLASQDEHVCSAVAQHNITCIVSRRMLNTSGVRDTMMSMERWSIAAQFLERGQRILHAGADFRFLQPLRSFYDACGAVDAAFDGKGPLAVAQDRALHARHARPLPNA